MIQVMQKLKNTTTHSIEDYVGVYIENDINEKLLFVLSESDDNSIIIFTSSDELFTTYADNISDTWEELLNEFYGENNFKILLPIVDRKKIKTLITIYN